MLYLMTNILMPPIAMFVFVGKTKKTYCVLFIWCICLYLSVEHTVLGGVILYLLLSLSSFIFTTKQKKKALKFDKELVSFVFVFFLSILVFANLVSWNQHDLEVDSNTLADFDYDKANLLFSEKCGSCHKLNEVHHIGPSLMNILDRNAGTYLNYNYSDGFANAKFRWTKEKLKLFLLDQSSVVPGSRMMLSQLTEEEINIIVEFLDKN